jgi:pimeloyl-ACP methyl ester carboxylesterase
MDKAQLGRLISQLETLELTDSERHKAQGCFIDLETGNTHYEIKGEGEPVVLVHGYATPYYIYDCVFDSLVNSGFKVLRYDLLGRGLSERVKAKYTPELFAKQLYELTQALLGSDKFILFGTSMGGTITTTFCRLYPGRVKKLILLAPAGMDTFKAPFYMKICKVPVLGDIIFSIIGSKTLLKKCASELKYSPEEVKDYYLNSFAYAARYKGFVRSTLSSLRNTILKTAHAMEGYKSVAQQHIPILCIWGTDDKTMPYYQHERLHEVCPEAIIHTFEGSGHIFLFDEGERTMDVVFGFLSEEITTNV